MGEREERGPLVDTIDDADETLRERMKYIAALPRGRWRWGDVKAVYVEGVIDDDGHRRFPTLDETAQIFNMRNSRVREMSARDHWVEQRANFQASLLRQRQLRRVSAVAEDSLDIDTRAITTAKMGLTLVGARLAEVMKLQRDRQELEKQFPTLLETVPAIDAREMSLLANAADLWYKVAARALGQGETIHHEISGPDGGAINVTAELIRDDPWRLHSTLVAMHRAGQLTIDIEDAEEVTDGDALTGGPDA